MAGRGVTFSVLPSVCSAADEREDKHQLLQVQDQRRFVHHAEESMVQLHEPLDQGGGVHRLHQHRRVVSNTKTLRHAAVKLNG